MNWRGRPLTSHEVIVNTIAATTTRTGLTVHAELDTGTYPTGVKVSNERWTPCRWPATTGTASGTTPCPRPARPAPPPRARPAPAGPPGPGLALPPRLTGLPGAALDALAAALDAPFRGPAARPPCTDGAAAARPARPRHRPPPPADPAADWLLAPVLRDHHGLPQSHRRPPRRRPDTHQPPHRRHPPPPDPGREHYPPRPPPARHPRRPLPLPTARHHVPARSNQRVNHLQAHSSRP